MELSLSANIGKLRRAHGMTQEQLAEALGVTFAAVSKWERGASLPSVTLLMPLAEALNGGFVRRVAGRDRRV